MTLHAFDKLTNQSMKCADLPLELVKWMAEHFDFPFVRHVASVDPYVDALIPPRIWQTASGDLSGVAASLRGSLADSVPNSTMLQRNYGSMGALNTIREVCAVLEFASQHDCKVISVGD